MPRLVQASFAVVRFVVSFVVALVPTIATVAALLTLVAVLTWLFDAT